MQDTINQIFNTLKGIAKADMTTAEFSICEILIQNESYSWETNYLAEEHIVECIAQETSPIQCHFCTNTVKSVDEAIENDWIPSFYIGEDQSGTPVCSECREKYLVFNINDGEFELNNLNLEKGLADE